ncbi:MerR family transcriptional regulator [Pseudonocardiaceae bacterium YIM PH 21723]|nr:MerR family transcriptional regulator [Pseudonocardiaceae bacterium YIM PH 21723]
MSFSIAEVAESSGLSIDTLRYYERIGLIDPPVRDSGGRRRYTDDDLRWIEFLNKIKLTGMSIKTMREYAALRKFGDASAGRRKQIMLDQRTDVLSRIAELQSCLDVLNYKIDNYQRVEDRLAELRGDLTEQGATA